MRDLIIRIIKFTAIILGAALLLYLGSRFTEVTIAAVIAGILYYLSLPVVEFMEQHKINRVLAIIITLLFFAAIIVFLLLYMVPVVIEQLTALAEEAPAMLSRVETWIEDLRDRFGGRVSEQQFETVVERIASTAANAAGAIAGGIVTGLSNFASVLLAVVAGVVAAFYLLKDRQGISSHVQIYIPEGSQRKANNMLQGIDKVLSGFLRGQVTVALIVGALVGLALLILGIPYAFLLAIIATVFELVPYLGPILAAIPAILLSLAASPTTTILVVIAFLIIQQIESLILSPKIVGAHVRLHPVTVILSVLIGKQILGVLGIFVAVPIAGIVKVLVEQLLLSPDERTEAREHDEH